MILERSLPNATSTHCPPANAAQPRRSSATVPGSRSGVVTGSALTQGAWDPGVAGDLRRRHRRELCERILTRADALDAEERVLLELVFRDHRTVVDVAAARGMRERADVLRRRIRRLVRRVLGPEFLFVVKHGPGWTSERRRVAEACCIRGLSLRDAARALTLTYHVVRRERAAVRALFDAAMRGSRA